MVITPLVVFEPTVKAVTRMTHSTKIIFLPVGTVQSEVTPVDKASMPVTVANFNNPEEIDAPNVQIIVPDVLEENVTINWLTV